MATAPADIRAALIQSCRDILLRADGVPISGASTLAELGASSLDRTEILLETLERVGMKVPPVRLAEVRGLSIDTVAETFSRWAGTGG